LLCFNYRVIRWHEPVTQDFNSLERGRVSHGLLSPQSPENLDITKSVEKRGGETLCLQGHGKAPLEAGLSGHCPILTRSDVLVNPKKVVGVVTALEFGEESVSKERQSIKPGFPL
jgi:hypothetical protein